MSETTKETDLDNLSAEQLEDLKSKQRSIMKEQIPYLEVEEKYTNLKAKTAENRYMELAFKVKYAQMKMGDKESKKQPSKNKSNKK